MNNLLPVFLIFLFSCTQGIKQTKEEKVEIDVNVKQLANPLGYSLRGVSVVNEQVIWFSGAKGSILRTLDGGQTWDIISPPDLDSLDFRDIEAFSDNTAIVISAGYPSRVYRTVDAGINWELVHENTDSLAFMNSIAFSNVNEGIIFGDQMGGRHLLFKTINGGKSWTRLSAANQPIAQKGENGFAASGSCIAVNSDGSYYIGLGGNSSRIFYSKDGGDNWKAISSGFFLGGTYSGIYSIASSGTTLMAVGGDFTEIDSGRAAVFSKDGLNWMRCEGKTNGYRSIVDFAEKDQAWICAGSNGLEISWNDGQSWEEIAPLDVNTLGVIPNQNKCLLADKLGNLYSLTWHKL